LAAAIETKTAEGGAYEYGGIGEEYINQYTKSLADAFGEAQSGLDITAARRGWSKGDPYSFLEAAQAGQEEWLKDLGDSYEGAAKNTYDAWYKENTDAIKGKKTAAEVDAYKWTDMPDYDYEADLLAGDLTGGFEFGTKDSESYSYDPDLSPSFYGDFYKPPSSISSDETTEDDDVDETLSRALYRAPSFKFKSTAAGRGDTSSGFTSPFSSGSAKYY